MLWMKFLHGYSVRQRKWPRLEVILRNVFKHCPFTRVKYISAVQETPLQFHWHPSLNHCNTGVKSKWLRCLTEGLGEFQAGSVEPWRFEEV